MSFVKKILIVISFFFLLTNLLQAQAGNITVNLKNINGNSTPYPGANGKVYLYDSNYNTITSQTTDSSGSTTFTNQPYGTYYFEGYHNANPPTIFSSEYWGSTSINHISNATNLNLLRYLPYYLDYKVFINSTNVEVTNSTVTPGTQLRIEVTYKNPSNSTKTIKGRIVIDRNKTSNYDFDQTSLSDTIAVNGNRKFIYSYTPTLAGSYYGAAGTLTSIKNNFVITDGTGWFSNPMFTIVPSPPSLSSPSNAATEISTTPTLSWNASTGAESYQVQISAASTFLNPIFNQSGITSTTVIVAPALSDGTIYYWRVNASTIGGTSNWSSTRSFTTKINETRISTIDFSGLKWDVSSGYSGPGPNNWFNGINSVWVDDSGSLHLAIRKIGDKWYTAGITSQNILDYGEYSFSVSSDVELYDPNTIIGLFVYENDSKEIDIEFSRWGDVNGNPVNYAVQPASPGITSISFSLGINGEPSLHKFIWTAQNIKFQSYKATGELIKEWVYIGSKNPIPNQMKAHINFWLMSGLAPINQSNAEFVISNFKYTPLNLLAIRPSNNEVPTEFKLFQNYPNPFNPTTKIQFSIPKESFVRLSIYNAIGQEIVTLVSQELPASTYSIDFNATDIPNGIYFYSLQAGEFTQTKKMILIK